MSEQKISFDDGAAYERMMGKWSPLVGDIFLDWLRPAPGKRWVDIGCGNGAFTELIVERCSPLKVDAINPSEGQLVFARERHAAGIAEYHRGDAQSLPFPDASFDVAVMALVIFFVADPAKGIAEMARVVRPGGTVAAYAWDLLGGGFPFESIMQEIEAAGLPPPRPPQAQVSALGALRKLWLDAGLAAVETREISVTRSFDSFDDFWASSLSGTAGQMIANMPAVDADRLKKRVRQRVSADHTGPFTCSGRANAVKGRVQS